jgi:hypothetical protein
MTRPPVMRTRSSGEGKHGVGVSGGGPDFFLAQAIDDSFS